MNFLFSSSGRTVNTLTVSATQSIHLVHEYRNLAGYLVFELPEDDRPELWCMNHFAALYFSNGHCESYYRPTGLLFLHHMYPVRDEYYYGIKTWKRTEVEVSTHKVDRMVSIQANRSNGL